MAALAAAKDQTITALQEHVATLAPRVAEQERELALWRASGWWERRRMRRAWRGR
jgi:hypothetical protein